MKQRILCLLLATLLSVYANAMEVPTETVVQNLNGSQQLVKTYILSPGDDPQQLVEDPFTQEGYLYTFSNIVKEEHSVSEHGYHTETVTLETSTNDLSAILEQLAPTMGYDDGLYTGTLSLDHTSIHTEAAGYNTGSRTVSTTKTIGPVDRNDMSYVPATTTKDGMTLNLAGVEWQVIGTELVGDALAPASYQAIATYTGSASYRTATGYVTTATYAGEITHEGVESVTYRLTYLGTPEQESSTEASAVIFHVLPYVVGGSGLVIIAVLSFLLVRSRRALGQFQEEDLEEHNDEEDTP